MNILYISQYCVPDQVAAAFRTADMTKLLAEFDNSILLITGFPNNIKIRQSKIYNNKLFVKETHEKLKILRVFTPVDTKESKSKRIYNYLSFMINSLIAGIFARKQDLIYASTPPLFVMISAYILSRVKRLPLVLEIRDFWLDHALLLGEVKSNFLTKVLKQIEKCIIDKANHIVVISDGYKKHLLDTGMSTHKISVVYNGVNFSDEAFIEYNKKEVNTDDRRCPFSKKFIVCYAGNIGLAQNLDVILEAADLMINVDILFLLIGEGADKQRLVEIAKRKELNNVMFIDQVKRLELGCYMKYVNCCIVTLRKLPIFKIALPSKIFEYMAFGKPVIIGVDGEARKVIEESKAGLYFDVDNPQMLVEHVKFLKENENVRVAMGNNAREYAFNNFNREELVKNLIKVLHEAANT